MMSLPVRLLKHTARLGGGLRFVSTSGSRVTNLIDHGDGVSRLEDLIGDDVITSFLNQPQQQQQQQQQHQHEPMLLQTSPPWVEQQQQQQQQQQHQHQQLVAKLVSDEKSLRAKEAQLETVGDVFRYALTRFSKHKPRLCYGQGTLNAYEDVSLLVGETLGLSLAEFPLLQTWQHCRLTSEEKLEVLELIDERIESRRPVAYLVNGVFQQGERFFVDERVLIPRSYIGELLCSENYSIFGSLVNPARVSSVLDLCTGSGCLAVLAHKTLQPFGHLKRIDAVDLSPAALEVAKINFEERGMLPPMARLHQGDLFAPLHSSYKADLIISNPPYVDQQGMNNLPEEYRYEPTKLALEAGKDGLTLIKRILAKSATYLNDNGNLVLEIGRTAPQLEKAIGSSLFKDIKFLETQTQCNEVAIFSKKLCIKIAAAAEMYTSNNNNNNKTKT